MHVVDSVDVSVSSPGESLAGPYRSAARAFALAASSSRSLGGAFVSSERNSLAETSATPSTAAKKAASFSFDGFVKPLIFLTNCSEAARTSSSVTGGSKLKRGRIFLHIISSYIITLAMTSGQSMHRHNRPPDSWILASGSSL